MFMGLALSPPAPAATVGNSDPQSGKIVTDNPANFTPHILNGTVRSIVQVGQMVVVGGTFTQVRSATSSTVLTRNRVFAFNAATGVISDDFVPNPNGVVYKVQAAAEANTVYVAGGFTSAAGRSMPGRIFKANVATGAVLPTTTFNPPTINGDIRDLEVTGNRLWVAGKFTSLGGTSQRALGTLNATTGARDPYFSGVLAGVLRTDHTEDRTNVLQISSTPDNSRLTAIGNFTSVNGATRYQIASFDISGSTYALANWATSQFTSRCNDKFETVVSDVEYSPDGTFFVVSSAGGYGGYTNSMNGTSGCDVVARFDSSGTGTAVRPVWTAYTGGDTTWNVEVTDNVVFVGGHMRWQNNPTYGNQAGQGAVARPGIGALNTLNGLPYSWNPTRTLGVGVQDMLATSQGLWVGSDTDRIGNSEYHGRIAMFPLDAGKDLPPLSNPTLPGSVYSVASSGSQLVRRDFSGTTASSATNAPDGSLPWSSVRGAFITDGKLYTANSNGQVTKRTFNGTSYGAESTVATADALVPQSGWHSTDVPALTSLFYYDGRIHFTLSGDNTLYSRGFEVESDIVGQQRPSTGTVSGIDFRNVRGAFVADGTFYYATTGGQLFRADWANRAPVPNTSELVSGAGTGWASRALFVLTGTGSAPPPPPPPTNSPPTANASITCDLLDCTFDGGPSGDTDGTIASYEWDFGDSATDSGELVHHTYAAAGTRTVKLKVTDDDGASAEYTTTISPTDVASPVTFRGANGTVGNRTSHTATIPSTVEAGDALVLFFSANSTSPTYTGPAGWTSVQTLNGDGIVGRAWSKVATAADRGTVVRVTSSAYAKSHVAVIAYDGTDATAPVAASASRLHTGGATHTSPTVTAPAGNNLLLTYWADKSSTTTAWTAPAGVTVRNTGIGSPSGQVNGLLAESNSPVSGSTGGLAATANSSSSRGVSFSVVVH
jgi:hypothetical protein